MVAKYFAFAYLTVVLSISIYSKYPSAYAEEHHEERDRFDGSEFKASTFSDNGFEKTDYKELSSTNTAAADLVRGNKDLSGNEGDKLLRKNRENKGVSVAGERSTIGPTKSAEEHVIGAENRGPIVDLPGDWVPDKIDVTNNGGFGVIPDSGSPVPYRLNGHVDIERGRTWAD